MSKQITSKSFSLSIQSSGTPSNPLVHSFNISYVGAFRVPNLGADGASAGFGFAGATLAFNPNDNGLFITGNGKSGADLAEITIPIPINSTTISSLNTATLKQNFRSIVSSVPNPLTGLGTILMGGLLVDGNKLIGTLYAFYTGSAQPTSHYVLSSLTLSSASLTGLFTVGNLGGRIVGGYMCSVPSAWQSLLGAPFITGQADLSIISSSSSGPSAFGFDPNTLSSSGAAPIVPYVYYPNTIPLGPYDGAVDPLQNGLSGVMSVLFVPNTNSILFFGVTPTNYVTYGAPGPEAPWTFNNETTFQVWAYNANDFLSVKNGKLQPYQCLPYDVWNFTLPGVTNPNGQQGSIGGVAYDPRTGYLYISMQGQDRIGSTGYLPLIHVLQLTIPTQQIQSAPYVGTMAATPSTIPSPVPSSWVNGTGSVPAGTIVQLTAGNVYAVSPGATITKVSYFLDNSTTSLGNGIPSTIPNAQHNYILNVNTSGWVSGKHTISAQAIDSDGQMSSKTSCNLTIS